MEVCLHRIRQLRKSYMQASFRIFLKVFAEFEVSKFNELFVNSSLNIITIQMTLLYYTFIFMHSEKFYIEYRIKREVCKP